MAPSDTKAKIHPMRRKAALAKARKLRLKAANALGEDATPTKLQTKTKTTEGPRKRLRADKLNWKTVNTSTLPGMDAGGGMMMFEELDGVGVEWEEDGHGGKTARFVAAKNSKAAQSDDEVEEEKDDGAEEEEQEAEEDNAGDDDGAAEEDEEVEEKDDNKDEEEAEAEEEEEDEDADLPTFSGLEAEDLDDEDDEAVIPAEPDFNNETLPEWADIPVHNALKKAMVSLDYVHPTDIQKRAVPEGLAGRDVVGVAETGSGKTMAYSLPILSYLLRQPAPRPGVRRELSALILCPTRELAIQVNEALSRILKPALAAELDEDEDEDAPQSKRPPRISVGSIVGGLSAEKQKRILNRGCDILVATPGRLWDLLKMDDELAAGVRRLRFLVIDEADRMIETGHFAELETIVQLTQRNFSGPGQDDDDPVFANSGTKLTETKAREDMQTFVFSATLSKDLQQNLKRKRRAPLKKGKGRKASALEDLVERLDFRDAAPAVIDLSPEGGLVKTLRESMIDCVVADKDLYLYYFLLRYPGRSLVFCGSIDGIRRLVPLLETLQVPVYPLHSQLQQKQRLRNLDRFKSSTNGVLIATDVAARGLDIPHVDHVIHFNLPRTADAYVHRSGRTARAQNPGFALQLVAPEDKGVQRALLKSLERTAPPPDLPIEGGFLPKLKERIGLARDIEKAQHQAKKANHDRTWLQEAAEAMDVDIDPSLLSEEESDADAPFARKRGKGKGAISAGKAQQLKAKLSHLLAQPLLARGVSARYPTSGSRVIVDDVVSNTAHGTLLGANTATAYDQIEGATARPLIKAKPRAPAQSRVQTAQKRKDEKRNEKKRAEKRARERNGGDGGEDDGEDEGRAGKGKGKRQRK